MKKEPKESQGKENKQPEKTAEDGEKSGRSAPVILEEKCPPKKHSSDPNQISSNLILLLTRFRSVPTLSYSIPVPRNLQNNFFPTR